MHGINTIDHLVCLIVLKVKATIRIGYNIPCYHDDVSFVNRGRASHGRVPMCSLQFGSNTCVCYCFDAVECLRYLFKCLIDKTNIEIELYTLLVSFRC